MIGWCDLLLNESVEVGLSNDTSAGVDGRLHLGDLRVNLLHELDDKINQLVLVHGLSVEVGDEEGDIVTLDGLTAEDDEGLGALGQETHKLLGEQLLELIGLLHTNADAERVDRTFNQNLLLGSTSDGDGVQQELGRGAAGGNIEFENIEFEPIFVQIESQNDWRKDETNGK